MYMYNTCTCTYVNDDVQMLVRCCAALILVLSRRVSVQVSRVPPCLQAEVLPGAAPARGAQEVRRLRVPALRYQRLQHGQRVSPSQENVWFVTEKNACAT